MKQLFLLIFFSVILVSSSFSQKGEVNDGFAARMFFVNHIYQIEDKFRWDDFTSGIEFEYNRKLSNLLSLAIPIRMSRTTLPIDNSGATRSAVSSGIDALLVLYPLNKRKFVNPFIFGGLGLVGDNFVEDFYGSAPVGLGFNFYLGRNTFLSTRAGYRFGFKDLRNSLEFGAGFVVTFGGEGTGALKANGLDTDGDGIKDSEDLCPNVHGPLELNGCPDKDGDGVTDNDDNCPDMAGLSKYMGCPDSDGDGVSDDKDKCPDVVGSPPSGCPSDIEIIEPDSDGDSIIDIEDDCPTVAGLITLNGCPDSDKDGTKDGDDKCPNTPGPKETMGCPDTDGDSIIDIMDDCPTVSGLAANNGCPNKISTEDKETLEFALKAVQFETASATLKSTSYSVLDKIVDILKKYVGHKLAIGGYTDSIGSKEKNQVLSEKRAKACYDYFIQKGISEKRMSYKGYGENDPIGDNMYKAGRELNRRVKFDLYIE